MTNDTETHPNGREISDGANDRPTELEHYDQLYDRLSKRTKAALDIIQLECETIHDLMEFHKTVTTKARRADKLN